MHQDLTDSRSRLSLPSEGTAGTGPPDELTRTTVFELLSNPRRRFVLDYFERQGLSAVTLRELSREITAWEQGIRPEAVTYQQRRSVYTALRQTHLPRMDDMNVVAYDGDRGIVRRTPLMDEVLGYLDAAVGETVPWHRYYLSVGVVTLCLNIAVVGLSPGAVRPYLAWSCLLLGGVVTLAVAHCRRERRGDAEWEIECPK